MPDACVVYGCNNVSDPPNGVGLHKIPYYGKTNPEEVRRRKKWVDFGAAEEGKLDTERILCCVLEALQKGRF